MPEYSGAAGKLRLWEKLIKFRWWRKRSSCSPAGISRYLASGIDGRGKPRRKTDHGYCPEARQMQCAGDRAALRRNRRECRATAKGDNRPCCRRAFALLRLAERTRQQILDLISDHGDDHGRTFPAGIFSDHLPIFSMKDRIAPGFSRRSLQM